MLWRIGHWNPRNGGSGERNTMFDTFDEAERFLAVKTIEMQPAPDDADDANNVGAYKLRFEVVDGGETVTVWKHWSETDPPKLSDVLTFLTAFLQGPRPPLIDAAFDRAIDEAIEAHGFIPLEPA